MSTKRRLDYSEWSDDQKNEAMAFYKANPIMETPGAHRYYQTRSAFVRFFSDGSREVGYEEPRLQRHYEMTSVERLTFLK